MLAPDLFCRAIDWLMSRVKPGGNLGIRVGQNTFDDLDYADDGALLPFDRTLMTALLERFAKRQTTWVSSWAKTKIQNVGHGSACPAISVGANAVDSVNEFIFLGSKVTTDGHSAPEVMRRMASAMNQLGRVWRQRNLSFVTKLSLYESCVLSVLLHCAETWTRLKTDVIAFHSVPHAQLATHPRDTLVRSRNKLGGEGPHTGKYGHHTYMYDVLNLD